MNYKQAVDWINSFQKHGVKLGLDRIQYLCNKLNNPQDNLKIIHVGGTNGKGSVCKYISSILTESGYKTGTYTSPHLQRFSERFVINNKEIRKDDIIKLVEKIKPIVENMKSSPTYFEIITAMALVYFKEKKVDFAVIEVGLGGRFDATNIVKPILTIITNVSLEHSNILGKNIKNIAYEKAGIIKKDTPVVTAAKNDALEIIKKASREKKADIRIIKKSNWKRIKLRQLEQEFHIKTIFKKYSVKTKILGEIQGENIALSISAIELLQKKDVLIHENNINNGIRKTTNTGRLEIIKKEPIIIVDGAHNISSIKKLSKCLKKDFEFEKLILIIGILRDKEVKKILKIISSLPDTIIITKSTNTRSCEPHKIKQILNEIGFSKKIIVNEEVEDAIKTSFLISEKKDLICITGSLFLIGEVKDYFQKC